MTNSKETGGQKSIKTLKSLDKIFDELKGVESGEILSPEKIVSLAKSGEIKYSLGTKVVEHGGDVACSYQEWIFPMSMKNTALWLACMVWDEGNSLWVPTRDTHVLIDEDAGSVTVSRCNFFGPVIFNVD